MDLQKCRGYAISNLLRHYFHNGGTLTLRGVLNLYSRGGDFAKLEQLDGSEIVPLNILKNSDQEKRDLDAFLLSLTDERVRRQQATFDHPQLFIPNGHKPEANGLGNTRDKFFRPPFFAKK